MRRLRSPGPGFFKTCPACGSPGRLIAGACRRCHLRQRLGELLADGTGNVRPEMQVLHQTLATTDRPAAVLAWLSSGTSQTMLTELAAGLRPLTHAALDELPASKPLTHLRSVLVATGALPARDEHFVQLERWTTQTVAGRADPREKRSCTATRPGTSCAGGATGPAASTRPAAKPASPAGTSPPP
jgi:hypothetical protein